MTAHATITKLSDDELLHAVEITVGELQESLADLLVSLAEVDHRKLYRVRAYDSMFTFCTGHLNFSEGQAYRRIGAARAARRFPLLLELVRAGELHLTGVNLLAPHLTDDNHRELLRAACRKSKRAVQELLAVRFPQPEPKATIHKLPAPCTSARQQGLPAVRSLAKPPPTEEPAAGQPEVTRPMPAEAVREQASAPRPTLEPVAADRYKVTFAASKRLVGKLDELRCLRSFLGPEALEMERMLEDAVDLLIAHERKQRFAVGAKPRKSKAADRGEVSASRQIPAEIRRAVYERDGGCCTYLHRDREGERRRCGSRWKLTFEHLVPFAVSRRHRVDEITLRCAGHNRLAADQAFGAAWMEQRVQAERRRRATDAGARQTPASSAPRHTGPRRGVPAQLDLLANVRAHVPSQSDASGRGAASGPRERRKPSEAPTEV